MQLSLQGLELAQLQGTFGAVWLELTNIVELKVALEKIEDVMHIRDLSAQKGELQIKLPLTDGEVIFASPLQLEGLVADLQNPDGRPFTGTASLTALKIPGLLARLPQLTLSAEANATTVLYERLPVGDSMVFFQTLTLQNISIKNDAMEVGLATMTLHGAKLSLSKDAFQLSCTTLRLEKVSVRTAAAVLTAESLDISEGVLITKHQVSLGQIDSEALVVSATFSDEEKTAPKEKKPGPSIDLRILDGIEGKLDADIDVKVRVPVIGHRHAVHRIRMPIEEGAINFNELKNDLAFLEGSLLDFVVEDDQLVLMLDLPIFSDKPLVYWQLDSAGQKLAARDRVLLRALTTARPVKGKPKDDDDEPKRSPLEHLAVENIDLDMVLFSQEGFTLEGAIPRVSVGQLAVKGHLRHFSERESHPTTLEILAKSIALSLYDLSLGERALSVRSIDIGTIQDGALVMNGLRPASLQLTLSQLKLRGVSL